MQHDDEPAVLGCTEQLGQVPKRDALTRLKRLHELLAHGRSVDGYLGAAALAAGIAEIEALREELAQARERGEFLLEMTREAQEYATNYGGVCLRQQAELNTLRTLLARYRDETPLGNQPHMIAHEADMALGRVA